MSLMRRNSLNGESLLESLLSKKEDEVRLAFNMLDTQGLGTVLVQDLEDALVSLGLDPNHPEYKANIQEISNMGVIEFDQFYRLMTSENCVQRALTGRLAIPNFAEFCASLVSIFEEVRDNYVSGETYKPIDELAKVDPDLFGFSFCTVDGQKFSFGDSKYEFSMHAIHQPFTYCLLSDDIGTEKVHEHIGREPSGAEFDAFRLTTCNKPHNPMINTGSFVMCSLLRKEISAGERFEWVQKSLQNLAGDRPIGFNQPCYLSEKNNSDRNHAISYYMRGAGAFPPGSNSSDLTMDLHFQLSNICTSCETLSTMASTLANAGVCPPTSRKCISTNCVKNCLALLYSCGMNDFSGDWAFQVGVPAKSGVSGALMVVIPNVMGLVVFSPRLDSYGNSVRGVAFCKAMLKQFRLGIFDLLVFGAS